MTSESAISYDALAAAKWRQIDESCKLAWAPREKLTPSEWTEKNRVLSASITAEPGPYSFDRTPYLRGIMDAMVEDIVRVIVFLKPGQIGGSEMFRNIQGYIIDHDPGPCLWGLPNEQAAREALAERIKPMIEDTPAVRRHKSDRAWDNKATAIHLDTCSIFVGWSGSPQTHASRPIRFYFGDEIDKNSEFSAREADTVSLAEVRLITFKHRAREFLTSTPTTRDGNISKQHEACGDKRRFWMPCPHCEVSQTFEFSRIKWDRAKGDGEQDRIKMAERIQSEALADYICEHCAAVIGDHEKQAMMLAGEWRSDDGCVPSSRVGFHLNSLYSPWLAWSDIAAEFIRSIGDPGKLMNFRNSWLAEPFEDQIAKVSTDVISLKAEKAGPVDIVPAWASALIATADTQTDHFYYTVRAWGADYRSQLISYGKVASLDELLGQTLLRQFEVDSGGTVKPSHLLIDSGGDRTDTIYQFAGRAPEKIWPTKGASHKMATPHRITKAGVPGVMLRMLDVDYYKTMLAGLINDDNEDRWMPHSAVPPDYISQMASQHRVLLRKGQTSAMRWVTVTQGRADHAWDCEVLQAAAAEMLNVSDAPSFESQSAVQQQADAKRVNAQGGKSRTPSWRDRKNNRRR